MLGLARKHGPWDHHGPGRPAVQTSMTISLCHQQMDKVINKIASNHDRHDFMPYQKHFYDYFLIIQHFGIISFIENSNKIILGRAVFLWTQERSETKSICGMKGLEVHEDPS